MQNKFNIYSCHRQNDGSFIYHAGYNSKPFIIKTKISNSVKLTSEFFSVMHEKDIVKIQNVVISNQLDMGTLLALFFNDWMQLTLDKLLSEPDLLIPRFLELLKPVGYKEACLSKNFVRDSRAICLGY